MDAAVLSGDLLDLLVQLDGVLLELGDVGIAVQGVHSPSGVPCRTGREFGAFEQNHIGPAVLREVVEDRRPDNPATDDHYLGIRLHVTMVVTFQVGLDMNALCIESVGGINQ